MATIELGRSPGPASESPRTHFAPPERARPDELRDDLEYITKDPVIDGLLRSVVGLVAVLNEQRQVLALNEHMLELLGLGRAGPLLGLRLGEAVRCVHSRKPPAGCGTTEYCSTCGAAIAMVTSLGRDRSVERLCAIDLEEPIGGSDQLFLRVLACPVRRGTRRILLLFLRDVTEDQQRAILERVFFHDVKNTLCALLGVGYLITQEGAKSDPTLTGTLVQMTQRLSREIELQRCLVNSQIQRFERSPAEFSLDHLLSELATVCRHHPAAAARTLLVEPAPSPAPTLEADEILVMRVVQNMIVNALEATAEGGTVKVWAKLNGADIEFGVWNAAAIPPDVALRVFQRNFSTKGSMGRGLGTYSMKLLGERLLHGKVDFTSTPADGTCFRFRLSGVLHREPAARVATG